MKFSAVTHHPNNSTVVAARDISFNPARWIGVGDSVDLYQR